MQKIKLSILALSFLFVCTGCVVTNGNLIHEDPAAAFSRVSANYDNFKNSTWINGASYSDSSYRVFLRAYMAGNDLKFIQLYSSRTSPAMRLPFYYAYDMNGNSLEFVEVDYDYWQMDDGQYNYSQDFAVELSYDVLNRHRQSGYSVRVYAKDGSKTYDLAGPYIDGFLLFIEQRANPASLK